VGTVTSRGGGPPKKCHITRNLIKDPENAPAKRKGVKPESESCARSREEESAAPSKAKPFPISNDGRGGT